MLISFTVENFRSYKDEATISFTTNKGKEMRNTHVFTPELKNEVKSFDLLHSAVIYGPNAGGKSNFVKALKAIKDMVGDYEECDYENRHLNQITPFLLSDKTDTKPTTFEIVMLIEGIRYQYGFSATKQKIHGEWLFAFPNGRMQKWFERTSGKKKKKADRLNMPDREHYDYEDDEYTFGTTFLKLFEPDKDFYVDDPKSKQDILRDWASQQQLLLFTAAFKEANPLDNVQFWFRDNLRWVDEYDIEEISYNNWDTTKYCLNNGSKKINDFLRASDSAIEGIEIDEHYNIGVIRRNEAGKLITMPLHIESDGTQRIFSLAAPFLETLENGGVLIVDELEQRLHPALTRDLIGLFHNPDTNPKNAQLIFTTHDVSLLRQDIFRRDQIWFCERGENRASTLFPLTDFKPRKGFENFGGYYMGGRYGALPFIGDFSKALQSDEDK